MGAGALGLFPALHGRLPRRLISILISVIGIIAFIHDVFINISSSAELSLLHQCHGGSHVAELHEG